MKENYVKLRGEEQKRKGLCQHCVKPKLEDSFLCEEHYIKQKSVQQLGTTKYWRELKSILDVQNNKCPYSDNIIILGKNSALDHKFPKKRFPELSKDINNVQWIDKKMNVIKNDQTHEELINLCLNIAKRYS